MPTEDQQRLATVENCSHCVLCSATCCDRARQLQNARSLAALLQNRCFLAKVYIQCCCAASRPERNVSPTLLQAPSWQTIRTEHAARRPQQEEGLGAMAGREGGKLGMKMPCSQASETGFSKSNIQRSAQICNLNRSVSS